jgi:rubrerythrin
MIVKFLQKCADIEHMVSEIYLEYSNKELNDEVLKEIWKKLSRDEQDHCQQLKLASRLPVAESFAGISDKCPDPNELFEQAGTFLEDAKAQQLSVLDMLKTAVILEKEFRKLHALYALEFKDHSLKKTFQLLASDDQEHLIELDAYLKKYKMENPS